MEAEMLQAYVLGFKCALNKPRWLKLPELSATMSLIIVSLFRDIKHQVIMIYQTHMDCLYVCYCRGGGMYFTCIGDHHTRGPSTSFGGRSWLPEAPLFSPSAFHFKSKPCIYGCQEPVFLPLERGLAFHWRKVKCVTSAVAVVSLEWPIKWTKTSNLLLNEYWQKFWISSGCCLRYKLCCREP